MIALALLVLAACHWHTQPGGSRSTLVLHSRGPSDTLLARMDSVLFSYYLLKDDMVNQDTASADTAVLQLSSVITAVPLSRIKNTGQFDQAHGMAISLQGEITGFAGEDTREGKLEEFQMISDITYDLVRTVGLQNQTVYRQYCPMAFNYRGAYWLSNRRQIENPYFGREMLDCGQVRETMKY